MSAAVDANVLLYASDEASPVHDAARRLLERLAAGPDLLYLFWPVAMAYLRIATHPAIFARPLDAAAASANLEGLLLRAHVRAPGEDRGFWELYRQVVAGRAVRANAVPDAHIATLMRQYGVRTIWSRDRDFRTFDGIDARDPFAAA